MLALRSIPESPLRDRLLALVWRAGRLRRGALLRRAAGRRRAVHVGAGGVRRVPEADGAARGPARPAAGGLAGAANGAAPAAPRHGGEDMDIGIPREIRPREHRVALTPSGVRTLVQKGHRVWVESDAGLAAGHANAEYQAAGAQIAYSRHEVFARGSLVITVFAPDPAEYELLEQGQGGVRLLGPAGGAAGGLPRARRARGDGDRHRGDRGRRRPRAGAPQHVRDRRRPGGDRREHACC